MPTIPVGRSVFSPPVSREPHSAQKTPFVLAAGHARCGMVTQLTARNESRHTRIRQKMEFSLSALSSIWNLGLDQFRQLSQRFLPAEIARFGGNNAGNAFLHHV